MNLQEQTSSECEVFTSLKGKYYVDSKQCCRDTYTAVDNFGNMYACRQVPKEMWNRFSSVEGPLMSDRKFKDDFPTTHEVMEDDGDFFLIQEPIKCDLARYILMNRTSSETEVRRIAWQILKSVERFHSNGVAINDLTLNILVLNEKDHVKFGQLTWATDHGTNKNVWIGSKRCSPAYVSPEVLVPCSAGAMNMLWFCPFAADMWSFGVILYTLLYGVYPFTAASEDRLYDAIIRDQVEFPQSRWVSPSVQRLISRLLSKDPMKRPTAREVMQSEWLRDIEETPSGFNKRMPINNDSYPASTRGQTKSSRMDEDQTVPGN
eukprot:Clim_evm64s146 gene=Clim_evmTU64s146